MLPIATSANLSQLTVKAAADGRQKKWPRKPGPSIQIIEG
jgi:hypothetical protein